jgi:hypothetical protein
MAKKKVSVSRNYRIHQHLETAMRSYQDVQNVLRQLPGATDKGMSELVTDVQELSEEFYQASLEGQKEQAKFEADDYAKDPKLVKFLASIGITRAVQPFWPVYEDAYLKFMSNHGRSDEAQADMFEKWLKKKKLKYERTGERNFGLSVTAQRALNKLWPAE